MEIFQLAALVIGAVLLKSIIKGIMRDSRVWYHLFRWRYWDKYDASAVNAHFASGEYGQALERVERFLAGCPKNFYALNDKGRILVRLGRQEEALVIWLKLSELLPDHSSILNNISWAYDELNLYKACAYYADRAIKVEKSESELVNRGNAAFGQSNNHEAQGYYDQALALSPKNSHAHWGKGVSHLEAGEYEDALHWLLSYQSLCPDDLSVYKHLIAASLELGEIEKAIAFCREKIARDPGDYGVRIMLGKVLMGIDRYHEAIEVLDQAIAARPDYSAAFYGKSICLARSGRFEEVLPCLQQAIELDSDLLLYVKNEPSLQPVVQGKAFRTFVLESVCGGAKEENMYH